MTDATNTAAAVRLLRPGRPFSVAAGIVTMDDGTPAPTATEIAEATARLATTSPVPASVSAFQARAALRGANLLDTVEATVAAAPPIVQDAWEYAIAFERRSPTIAALAAAIGLDDAALDDLFRTAATITA